MKKKRRPAKQRLPRGWTPEKIRQVIAHYEDQSDDEAVAEDEAAFGEGQTLVAVPVELLPKVAALLARHRRG